MRDLSKLVVAVDFDGVLFVEAYPDIGSPIAENIELIKTLKKAGAKIILWTCRNGKSLEHALRLCWLHGLSFDAVNDNLPETKLKYGGDTRKVSADIYWDDHGYNGSATVLSDLLIGDFVEED